MTEELREYLRCNIATDSMESLCNSINEIGPYVSGLAISNPMSISSLHYYTFVGVRRDSYRQFHIPKKSGGVRTITAPEGELKDVMLTLAFMLLELYIPTPEAMAFIPGKSIVENANQHLGQNYVLNLDLSDFFTSITANMVEHNLVKLGIAPLVARDIATICTYPVVNDHRVLNVVPQGAPTSPVISNICAMTLDNRLSGLARRFHLTYTRYADDITFSSNHNVYQKDGAFMAELNRIIAECQFTINPKKTRLQKRGSRQEVTGLTVGQKTNVSRKYIKNLRVLIHRIKYQESPTMHDINVVRGKLNFLRMVKGADNPTYIRYIKKLNMAVKGKHFA
jgi:retron-type reverse transcriptase